MHRSILLMVAALTMAACQAPGPTPAEPSGAIPLAGVSALPAEPPTLRGEITAREADGRLRVEEKPEEEAGSEKALVRLVEDALVLNSDGSHADAAELTVGRRVAVWFTGPVMESYPVQAAASVVVLD